jgi:hypothetical protein
MFIDIITMVVAIVGLPDSGPAVQTNGSRSLGMPKEMRYGVP